MPGETIDFQLIVGLGNPGSQYQNTRHNAGFWFIDELARQCGGVFKPEGKFFGELAKGDIGGQDIFLFKPADFMNLSGKAVAALVRFYKIPPDKILIVHDELDLAPGILRLKKGGGHGGHNGLRDVVSSIGSSDFWRLRVGIGHPGHKSAVSGYVLKRASAEDQRLMDEAIGIAVREADNIVGGDINAATKTLHSHKPPQSEPD